MKHKQVCISALSILVLVTLGCGFLGGIEPTVKPTEAPTLIEASEPTEISEPTDEPEPTLAPEPTQDVGPDFELGEEVRSKDGGYAFRAISGYTVDGELGMTMLQAPDADPDTGPAIMMMGDLSAESATPEELLGRFTSDMGDGVEASPPRKIDVDGKPGIVADVSGVQDGTPVVGRIVAVAVTPNHHFIMVAAAPADRWDAFVSLFDAVLLSVRFFPPVGAEGPPMGEETRQWAISATASSQYGDDAWSAMQATGAPDTPECGDYTTAWASEGYDTVEWIELDYETPVVPTAVNIFQSYNPDQVIQVQLRDLDGDYQTTYLGRPQDESGDCPFMLHIPVEGIDWQVDGVRITIDQTALEDWNEIDAVELVGIAQRPGG